MYRAAVIGLGNIGLRYDLFNKASPQSHSLAYHLNSNIDFVAAAGVREAQGDQLALIAPETRFYTDVVAMLKENHLDIISICTPTNVRLELLRTVFEHSAAKVIFLEKPVAASLEEALQIKALADHHNREVIVNFSRRWSPGAAQMREAVETERYGKLKKIHLRYTRGIYNYGSHLFDLVRFVAGPIDHVQVLRQEHTNLDVREDWTYSFTFTARDGSITGYAEAFDDKDFLMFEMDLYFEKGKIEMLQSGDEIRFFGTEAHPLLGGIRQLVLERTEACLNSRSSNIMEAVQHLVQVIKEKAAPVCSLNDGLYPLYVAQALQLSHRNNGSVEAISF
ncbi:Gfo/Idh/MocA family protein [Paenibacillus silviterrae]|uniref:Gfo/Idh/MocA family protein n=1 Tax=Paenibacillus silviterrae TaxID=3242194 RepID=UPI002543EA69|nr:Gfo/Idh/MocA family oxidoreductase [Paenibacillus chinjuensis]